MRVLDEHDGGAVVPDRLQLLLARAKSLIRLLVLGDVVPAVDRADDIAVKVADRCDVGDFVNRATVGSLDDAFLIIDDFTVA